MTIRTNASDASRRAQTSFHRCTIREFDDDHDIMEAKQADVMHSETPTGVQVHWPTGMTAHPMKQKEDQSQGQQGQQGAGQGAMGGSDPDMMSGFNNNQPKGESSIGHMSYYGGSRSNPVMSGVDDPRHRPYQTKEGESLFYAADGHGSCLYHRRRQDGDYKDGVYLIACDGNDEQQGGAGGAGGGGGASARAGNGAGSGGQGDTKRAVRIGHVQKKRQQRKKGQGQQGQQGGNGSSGGGGAGSGAFATNGGGGSGSQGGGGQQQYKHEGDSVNVETRWTKDKIDFYDADKTVGHYDKQNKDWIHHDGSGAPNSMRADQKHSHIRHGGGHVWSDGDPKKSKPFIIAPDDCQ